MFIVTKFLISIPAESRPEAVTAGKASPAASIVGKSANSTLTHSGARSSRTVMAVGTPSFTADQGSVEIQLRSFHQAIAQLRDGSIQKNQLQSQDMVAAHAIFE